MPQQETEVTLIGQLIPGGTYRCDISGANGRDIEGWFDIGGQKFTVLEPPYPRYFKEVRGGRWCDVYRTGVIIEVIEGVNAGRKLNIPIVCLGIADAELLSAMPHDARYLANTTYLLS